MNRRKFLKIAGISLAVLAVGSHCCLNDEKMKRPPKKEGKILADLHSHLGRNNDLEDIAKTLSWGITGLAVWQTPKDNKKIFSYEDAVQLPNVREIDLGLFAEITVNGSKGYFAKVQEFESDFHILAIGCHKYLPRFRDARKAVEAIHASNGIAILNHPCSVYIGGLKKFRLSNEADDRKINELCGMVDEVEVFNAQNINPTLGIVIPNMKKSNEKAKAIAASKGFKGVASSDAHYVLKQSKIAGIYIPEDNLCIDAIKEHIKKGSFERHEQYVSRLSFIKGMMFS